MAGGTQGSLVEYARDDLLAQIERAARRVWLVSPFLSGAVAEEIAQKAKASGCGDLRLLTALTERSVRAGVLAPKGLRRLVEAKFEVASIRDLHAKVNVVDNWGLVGSGNLTNSGLGGAARANIELGVILNRTQVTESARLFEKWWSAGERLTLATISKYEDLKPYPAEKSTVGDVGESIGVLGTAGLKEILEESPEAAAGRRYWIDPNYHDYGDEGWWHRGWVSDRRDAGIEKGDLIVIYLAAHDGGPAKCSAVGRALGPPRNDPDFILKERDIDAVKRWPWVTDIEIVADVPADDGVGLAAIGKDGRSMQSGPISITRAQFEELAKGLVS